MPGSSQNETENRSICAIGALLLAAPAFQVYPGSKLDESATREASSGKVDAEVYTTDDPMDKVHAFYKPLYTEFTMKRAAPKLASGQPVKWAFFILDGAAGLPTSHYWMKIKHPYVRDAEGKEVRDVTSIQIVRNKP